MTAVHLHLQATGLDLLQLNNWFINARVRIWRPIIVNVYQQQYDRLMAVAQAQVCMCLCVCVLVVHEDNRGSTCVPVVHCAFEKALKL